MGFLDNAKDLIGQHDEQVDQALEKGGELANDRFAGHEGQIDGGVDRLQAMTGEGDTVPDAPADPEAVPPQ
jgi:antitoxin protein of toxin-antitoxin system